MNTIRAVLFDLGDTLWHTPRPPARQALDRHITGRVERLLSAWGCSSAPDPAILARGILEAGWQASSVAYAGDLRSPDFVELAARLAADLGLDVDSEQATALWEAANPAPAFLRYELFPDCLATLRHLRAAGLRVGIVTNRATGGPPLREAMRELGLLPLVDTLVLSCECGWLKPAPQSFGQALSALKVAPEEAIMVGDSMRADIAGARMLGMLTVWKRLARPVAEDARLPDGREVVPDFTIDCLSRLRRIPHLPIY